MFVRPAQKSEARQQQEIRAGKALLGEAKAGDSTRKTENLIAGQGEIHGQ